MNGKSVLTKMAWVVFFCLAMPALAPAASADVPARLAGRLAAGIPQEVIVLLDATPINQEIERMRLRGGKGADGPEIRLFKAQEFNKLKNRVLGRLRSAEVEVVRDFSHLPLMLLRCRSSRGLSSIIVQGEVLAVYENNPIELHLAESLPLVGQPQTYDYGYGGNGVSVAVIDTGVDYTRAAFGFCTAPGSPAGCRVVYSADIATEDNSLDDYGHGTNVAGIVAGIAPEAAIISLDIFSGGSSSDALVLAAINWAIANQDSYNIAALNLSLGNGVKYTQPCSNTRTNPYVVAVGDAKAAGILTVASSGNNGFLDGIASPACTPGVISVGAGYDANLGGLAWSTCTDYTTAPDKVTCFSNSAYFLTLLAPGALINAAGISMGGTSQAAPHVAGAVAVLRSANSTMTLDETVNRLTATGKPVVDQRNSIQTSRLNLFDALGPYAHEDVPMLPWWGVLSLFGAITGVQRRKQRRKGQAQT
jgi:subtilisin family serine protease